MKIQKKLFTFVDTWPWAMIMFFVVGIDIAAIVRFTSVSPTSTEIIQLLVLFLVSLVFAFLTGYHYDERWMAVRNWNRAYQTHQGTAIMPDLATYATIKNRHWYPDIEWGSDSTETNPLYLKIADEIDSCCKFWNSKFANGNKLSKLQMAFSGATISIVNRPFEVTFLGKVMGTQVGQNIQVVFDGQRIQTEEQLIQLIRHECSHLCLTVLGVSVNNETQHSLMREYNFG